MDDKRQIVKLEAEKAKIHRIDSKKPEPALCKLETSGINFYQILKACQDDLLALDDAQLGRVMRTVIANSGDVYVDSGEECEAYASILISVIWELV